MIESIHRNQADFLARLISDHFHDLDYTDINIAAEVLPKWRYRNILRLYYNRFYSDVRREVDDLIEKNMHKISTIRSQYGEPPSKWSKKTGSLDKII